MAITYPTFLPKPQYDGYGIEQQDAVLRTEMESGPARQRLRYTQVPSMISVQWWFSDWHFALFESWFENDAKRGAEYFTIELFSGLGNTEHEARFAGQGNAPYRAVPQAGGWWKVTSSLEIRQRDVLSDEVLEVAITENGDIEGLIEIIDNLHVYVHTTLPADIPA